MVRETFLTTRATSLRGLGSCWGSVPGGSPGAGQGREEQSVISSGPIKIPAGQRRPVLPRCFIHGRPGSTNKPGLSCCPLCSVPAEPGTAERERQSGAGASPPGVRELLWHQRSGCSPSPSSGQAGSAPGSAILSQFLCLVALVHLGLRTSSLRQDTGQCLLPAAGKGHCKQSNSGRASLSPRRSFLIEYQTHPDLPSTLNFRGCLSP